MSDVAAYHPETGAVTAVPEEAMPHLRVSGWLLLSEHQANQDQAAAAEAAAAKTAAKEK